LPPSAEHVEYPMMLLWRAEDDLGACRVLADVSEVADGAVGFHAQQVVEKVLKAAIVLAEIKLPHTHDLDLLIEQAAARMPLPTSSPALEWTSAALLREREESAAGSRHAVAGV
jgi:HEPN domain-containing protein